MARPSLRIEVATKDQKTLAKLLSGGLQQVRVVLRAVALLQLGNGVSAARIASIIPLTAQAIRKVGHRYQQGGLERALHDKQRPGAAELLDDSQKQRIIAMVCSDPPEGLSRWTIRLVAEEAVKRKLVPTRGKGNHPDSAAPPRLQAVAGKKCGAWPTSMKTISPRWKMFWRSTNGPPIPNNRSSVWMRTPLRFMPMCGLPLRPYRGGKRAGTTNMNAAGRPMCSVRWNPKRAATSP